MGDKETSEKTDTAMYPLVPKAQHLSHIFKHISTSYLRSQQMLKKQNTLISYSCKNRFSLFKLYFPLFKYLPLLSFSYDRIP